MHSVPLAVGNKQRIVRSHFTLDRRKGSDGAGTGDVFVRTVQFGIVQGSFASPAACQGGVRIVG